MFAKYRLAACAALALSASAAASAAVSQSRPDLPAFRIDSSVRIPMRDGVKLSAVAFRPQARPREYCLVAISPYGASTYYKTGSWFAAHGVTFLSIDSRGRGGSEGHFRPFVEEIEDGHDAVEWAATQSECHGKIASWGGSYVGAAQWATIKAHPPHLLTMVPTAAVYPGLDFPMQQDVGSTYSARWLAYVSGHAVQEDYFGDSDYWLQLSKVYAQGAMPFNALAEFAGDADNAATFTEWAAHPHLDAYWARYVPGEADYKAITQPILTITGIYDADQQGALAYYTDHMRWGSEAAKARHYLVIGPWDHSGTRRPTTKLDGLEFGDASVIDMNQLHLQWYDWVIANGPRPDFLKDRVAYWVMGTEKWRYAPSLEAVTSRTTALYLGSSGSASDLFHSGVMEEHPVRGAAFDSYVHDPISPAYVDEATSMTDQSRASRLAGHQLLYHTKPFAEATEVSGFFRLTAWIAIDQPDCDFVLNIYEITTDGRSIPLSSTIARARHRAGVDSDMPIRTTAPLRYDFDSFSFASRQVAKGSRLRLMIAPANEIGYQKNYNSDKPIAVQTAADARTVTVRLYHDTAHPSMLNVPIGRPDPTL